MKLEFLIEFRVFKNILSVEVILIKLSDLPFVKNNYLDIDIIEVKPYRGFV